MRDRFLWIGCALYAALFTWLGVWKYQVHRNLVDFGIFAQTVTSAFGCFCNAIEGSHYAFHFSPVLYLVAAVAAAVHTPYTLIALQAIAGALVAPPIYALVLRARGDRVAARRAAFIVWLYPALGGLIFGDFHENGFAPAAVAWTIYAFDNGWLPWTCIFAALTLSIKEDQALFLAVAGLLGAWRFRGTAAGRVAGGIALVSLLLFAYFFGHIQPHAARAAAWRPERFYAWTAQDLRALWPAGVLERAGFVVLSFAPLLFLPFASPMGWLVAAPLGEVLLSRMPTTFTLGSHYAGAWIGWVLAAFAFGVRRVPERRSRVLLAWCIALCVLELLVADPLHPGLNLRPVQARDRALDRFLATLPPGVSVATQEEAYTHLAFVDPKATLLPEQGDEEPHACFVLVDRAFPDSPRLQEYSSALAALVRSGRYVLNERKGTIALYRRAGSCDS